MLRHFVSLALWLGLCLWFGLGFVGFVNAGTITWIGDNIVLQNRTTEFLDNGRVQGNGQTVTNFSWVTNVDVTSNGAVYYDPLGHFRLNIFAQDFNGSTYEGSTSCINLADNGWAAKALIEKTSLDTYTTYTTTNGGSTRERTEPIRLSNLFRMTVEKQEDLRNSMFQSSNFTITFGALKRTTSNIYDVNISFTYHDCASVRTEGEWSDTDRWDTGVVPTETDDIMIPVNAGVIRVSEDIQVNSLDMEGGHILSYSTLCPTGWSVDPTGNTGIKCYKLFENTLAYYDAADYCNHKNTAESNVIQRTNDGLSGTIDSQLMQIRNREELEVAQRLCRGRSSNDPANAKGCWLGLHDVNGDGLFDWIDKRTVGVDYLFLDWRRYEPSNSTISKGIQTPGERCTELIPHQYDPLIQEQGSFNDESCMIEKPFLCQMYKHTQRYTFTVTGDMVLKGGELEGGILSGGGAGCRLSSFSAYRSARIELLAGATSTVGRVYLEDGSTLNIGTGVTLSTEASALGAYIGEVAHTNMTDPDSTVLPSLQMQPVVKLGTGVQFSILNNISITAQVHIAGTLTIGEGASIELYQGGILSSATLDLQGESSQLILNGYSSRLSTYDAFELLLMNNGEFRGEYYGNTSATQELQYLQDQVAKGVYRLQATTGTGVEITECISYNATAEEMKGYLDALPSIAQRGFTTIRKYGNENSLRYRFGSTYRIEMDAPDTDQFALGALNLEFYCYGLDPTCDCADVKVPVKGGLPTAGMTQCYENEKRSLVDANACTLTPTITVDRISLLSATSSTGNGAIVIQDGVHRLPPNAGVTIRSESGVGVVAANDISWYGIDARDTGRITLGGTGWLGWDSTYLLYDSEWTPRRNWVSSLQVAPAFTMTATQFYLGGLGSILSSCPQSNLTWGSGSWMGGIVGGLVTLYITDMVTAAGDAKSLRYAITVNFVNGSTLDWFAGDFVLADGSNMVMAGDMNVLSTLTAPVRIGMSLLLQDVIPDEDMTLQYTAILERSAGREWSNYWNPDLLEEAKGGWYTNPLCMGKCLDTSYLIIDLEGTVNCNSNSSILFHLPINLIGNSRLETGFNTNVQIASGGICGNSVVMNVNFFTTLTLSGGQMLMEAACTIIGEGKLLVTGGSHDLSTLVQAHITIEGGALVWPARNGNGQKITFEGGLTIKTSGKLIIEPYSTEIDIMDDMILMNQSVIQFPLLGVGAQASTYDRSDAPDVSPRGVLTCFKNTYWLGGTIRGKADFVSMKDLYLDDEEKYIESLAKLISRGWAQWGLGTLVASDLGSFVNFGDLQLKPGIAKVSFVYEGTEIPKKNGGDKFAKNYNVYDFDFGSLKYDEYLDLRKKFVSRVPEVAT